MLTPKFLVKSNKKSVSITIDVPFCCVDDFDVNIENDTFMFYCKPYYLHLRLSCKLIENDNKTYDEDEHQFSFTYDKQDQDDAIVTADLITNNVTSAHKNDHNKMYGFAMSGDYNLENIPNEYGDIFSIDPTNTELIDRKKTHFKEESKKFDIEHYMCDLIDEDNTISNIIKMKAPWEMTNEIKLTQKELDFLKDLKQMNYSLNSTQLKFCYNSLLDILFAYCYDQRTTDFEGNCESSWTISKISASLCYFDGFLNMKEALISAFRRSLVYPIYRSYNLSQKVFCDLKSIVKLGEEYIIKCLIKIFDIFSNCHHSGGHIVNEIFIQNYITFLLTKHNKNEWAIIIEDIEKITIEKNDLELNLPNDENDTEIFNMTQNLSQINL